MARDFRLLEINPKIEMNTSVEGKAYRDIIVWDFIVGKGMKRYIVKVPPQGHKVNFGVKSARERISGGLSMFE